MNQKIYLKQELYAIILLLANKHILHAISSKHTNNSIDKYIHIWKMQQNTKPIQNQFNPIQEQISPHILYINFNQKPRIKHLTLESESECGATLFIADMYTFF